MHVLVKLYASLRKYAPNGSAGSTFEIELPEEATLEDLMRALNIPSDEARIAFVNGIIREIDHTLKSGDEVGLFPPIAGG
jgi:molybdopterin converting factor small subunit